MVDANHDGKSWVDANNDGIKGAGEVSELMTFADLGITQINLNSQSQSGEVRDGNEVLAHGTFVQGGVTKEAIAANFLNNPAGSNFGQTAGGVVATQDGSGIKSYVSTNTDAAVNENLDAATLAVRNLTGGAGNDTLTGDAQNNWLIGSTGADTFIAGAGDDVLLIDAQDTAIDGGDGFDMVQVVGGQGVTLNMANSHVEVAIGNNGDDVFVGGGRSSVFVRAGDGDEPWNSPRACCTFSRVHLRSSHAWYCRGGYFSCVQHGHDLGGHSVS